MARFTLENILSSDSESELINKLNSNFSGISYAEGGTISTKGPTGERGIIGHVGPKGATGKDGKRGSRWFIQNSEPSGTSVNYGDYWLDSSGNCSIFSNTGWTFVSLFKRDQDLFKTITGIAGPSGESFGKALVLNQDNPEQFGFVFSDKFDGTDGNQNPDGSKVVVSTSPGSNAGYLMEFSRIDKEISGHTGEASDFSKHPFFSWYGSQDESNLKLSVPGGNLALDYGNQLSDKLEISATNDIDFQSGATLAGFGLGFLTYSDQNWYANNLSFNTPGSSFSISSSNDNFDIGYGAGNYRNFFGKSTDFNFNFFPALQRNDGYLKISRDPNYLETDPRISPLRVVRKFSYGSELNSSSVNLMKIQSGSRVSFSASANGKIYTRKTSERYDNRVFTPVFTYQTSGNKLSDRCNWYELPPLDEIDGSTIFLDPTLSSVGPPGPLTAGLTGAAYVGIGMNVNNFNNSQILKAGEMVTYRVICSKQNPGSSVSSGSLSGISMVGYWTSSRPSTTTDYKIFGSSVTDVSACTQVDFSVMKFENDIYYVIVSGYSFLNGQSYFAIFTLI
jgi:hypothetical protein